jgi:hypothetical protein
MNPAETDGELDIRLAIKERKTVPFPTLGSTGLPLPVPGEAAYMFYCLMELVRNVAQKLI